MRLSLSILAALSLSACAGSPPPVEKSLSPAALIVQRQLDAYNAHDIDGFLATYSPEIEIFDLPDATKPTRVGLDVMRRDYGGMFSRLPNLHCDIATRIADGAFVVDHEVCTYGLPQQQTFRTIAIYQVEGGLIRRVWLAPADK